MFQFQAMDVGAGLRPFVIQSLICHQNILSIHNFLSIEGNVKRQRVTMGRLSTISVQYSGVGHGKLKSASIVS